jgi:8-oxo-dGTP pyrophosphatase MutT (NUDIX family)
VAEFERIGGEVAWEGKLATVRIERFRYADGEEAEREIVVHPGAVGILAVDGDALILVRQPRESVGEPDLLELPAGKLDEGEDPLATAQRELAEEVGKGARRWEHVKSFYTSPGFTDEECHVYLAEDLHDAEADADDNERIEIVRWPLDRLDDAIGECRDSKTLIALLWLKARRA